MTFVRHLDNTVLRFTLKLQDLTYMFKEKKNVDVSPRNITQFMQ